jgi:hypothetical protein
MEDEGWFEELSTKSGRGSTLGYVDGVYT